MDLIAAVVDRSVGLRSVSVRPILAHERERFDRLLIEEHYLHSAVLVGEALRYVATDGARWLALLGWGTAALKCAPRDAWIGWPARLRWPRLSLIANNARFLILPEARQPHLASRVLGLGCRRLARDWQAAFGHPVLVAETFVESERFLGTCYRAAGWELLGETKGFGRSAGKYYEHGVRKRILVKELQRGARRLLCDPLPHPEWSGREQGMDSLSLRLVGTGSLYEALRAVPDPRGRRGRSYRESAGLLVLAIAAVLAGQKSYDAIAEWVEDVPQELLRALGCRRDARSGRFQAPSEATLRRTISSADGVAVDQVFARWACQQGVQLPGNVIAIDGKALRGSHGDDRQQQVHLVAAFTHREGVVIAQQQVRDKSNEIPAVQEMIEMLDLKNATVTMDAMHTQTATAQAVVEKGGTTS
ncbi:MAG: ISAs1 family transposase [Armatimonadetes bacterium]|nr:ISAs1 family transposase [Armatimonadota bacterium]